jgi:hypothetical protein
VAERELDEATSRSEARRRRAEDRAQEAQRRVVVARRNADLARNRGNARAAAVHDHEAAIHQRAVEIHLQAVRLQQDHAQELADGLGRRGIDGTGLRHVVSNVRRARDEAALRGEQARTYSLRARERARRLQGRGDGDA